jgi:methyltransferase-like protein 6
MGQVSIETD